jgi:archaemetzincin
MPQEKNLSRMQRDLAKLARSLSDLHQPMGPVKSGDWLASHNEPGQTFRQYCSESPVKLTSRRKRLYVLPLGEFDEKQKRIVELSAEFLQLYFSCETKILDTVSLAEAIPEEARRVHPSWGVRQIKSLYVLDEVLPAKLPKDAVALIAFTTSDLYPDEKWNFVFGQASLRNRVGVWSLFRNGDPETEFGRCLERTLKTATHETGHMFSIRHCIAHDCNMCGSNSLQESDRRPLYLCPECLPKVWWSTKAKPVQRFEKLAEFCDENGLKKFGDFYRKSAKALESEK